MSDPDRRQHQGVGFREHMIRFGFEFFPAIIESARGTVVRDVDGNEILALAGSWHGMTAGAASSSYAGGHAGYGLVLPGTMAMPAPDCFRCPIRHCRDACDLSCVEGGFAMYDEQTVGAPAAVIAEPVLSAAGVIVPPPGCFKKLKAECERRGRLLILDEARTALGRLGANFAFELFDFVPDILSLSKTLGGGLPMAATMVSADLEERCHERGYMHVTSRVNDPLPAEVARAVIRVVLDERLGERAQVMGARLRKGLEDLQSRHETIGDIRGIGLLLGIEFVKDRENREPDPELGSKLARRCRDLGLNVNVTGSAGKVSVWRIAAPLTVSEEEIDRGLEIMARAFSEFS